MPLSLEAQVAQAQRTLSDLQTLWTEKVQPCHNVMVEVDSVMAQLVDGNR